MYLCLYLLLSFVLLFLTAVQEKENRNSDALTSAHKKEILPHVIESDLLLKVTAFLWAYDWSFLHCSLEMFRVKEKFIDFLVVNWNSLAHSTGKKISLFFCTYDFSDMSVDTYFISCSLSLDLRWLWAQMVLFSMHHTPSLTTWDFIR